VVVLALLVQIIHPLDLDFLVVLAGEADQIVLEQLVVLELLDKETLAVPPVHIVVAVAAELVELVGKEKPMDQELVVMDKHHLSQELQ
jgi:hypothetical protein